MWLFFVKMEKGFPNIVKRVAEIVSRENILGCRMLNINLKRVSNGWGMKNGAENSAPKPKNLSKNKLNSAKISKKSDRDNVFKRINVKTGWNRKHLASFCECF